MVEEGLSSEAEALEPRFASVVDAERARLLAIGERHEQIGPASRTEAPGDDQSIIASPQTEVASGQSIDDDEQRDEPGRRENILDHCRTPNRHAVGSVGSGLRSAITWLRNALRQFAARRFEQFLHLMELGFELGPLLRNRASIWSRTMSRTSASVPAKT